MSFKNITEKEVLEAQKKWASGVIDIGKKFLAKADYLSFSKIINSL